jgi:hypothetical protein
MKVAEKHKLSVLLAIYKSTKTVKSNDFTGKLEQFAVDLSGGNF